MRSARVPNVKVFLAVLFLVMAPAVAGAQITGITGVVRDSSSGVLPGVTVEAASPALIEKVRTAVTDDQGLYRIVDLRPGVYTVIVFATGLHDRQARGHPAHGLCHGDRQCGVSPSAACRKRSR